MNLSDGNRQLAPPGMAKGMAPGLAVSNWLGVLSSFHRWRWRQDARNKNQVYVGSGNW